MRTTLSAILLLLSAAGGIGQPAGLSWGKSVEAVLNGKEQDGYVQFDGSKVSMGLK